MKLKEILKGKAPECKLAKLVGSFDVFGDIAVIIIPDDLLVYEVDIGECILDSMANVRLVARRDGNYSGEYRTIGLRKIVGEGDFKTVHREFGINLSLDLREVYYSVRSGSERKRVAGCVEKGENILVMFSGIGPLPFMISKYSGAKKIIGVEKNPLSFSYAQKNLLLNKRLRNIEFKLGDVRNVVPELKDKFDRIAMVLPSAARDFLDVALPKLKNGGWLHYYDFQMKGEFEKSVDDLQKVLNDRFSILEKYSIHKCGHVAPGKYRICVDAKIGLSQQM